MRRLSRLKVFALVQLDPLVLFIQPGNLPGRRHVRSSHLGKPLPLSPCEQPCVFANLTFTPDGSSFEEIGSPLGKSEFLRCPSSETASGDDLLERRPQGCLRCRGSSGFGGGSKDACLSHCIRCLPSDSETPLHAPDY